MNAEHARPMMAYVALCLAASYVLGQGVVGSGNPVGPINIARAGEPVRIVRDIVTLSAAHEILKTGVGLVPSPIRGAVADSVSTSEPVRRVSHAVAATAPERAPQKVAEAPQLTRAPQATAHGKAAADQRRSDRIGSRAAVHGSVKADKPAKARHTKRPKR
jgi:hypothetical protein